ncbi:LytS/YhcK type 5TM receptor domain-containing protein [uncultured Tateyamaria sp.]|uniref:LytS/YhcK type 5TM receptor domain-containing protein n=1 Tax=uncultured Tateyamaria sp. TaxID=455651 RepID=UPI00261766AD|nr:LytS/YhcK type 5TM receptor domain-containing protein [uncultured Tateyamaria sp.]
MANVDATVLLDFVSSLAVLGLLVVSFSALAPSLKIGWFAPPLLGLFFGLVVGLQMSMPLSPTDGVIIDMRNVPIVLAGAFLGLRGLLTCLAIAVAFRLGIGGVGMVAGVAGMLIAGCVGYVWSITAARFRGGDTRKLLILGLGVNLHMLSAFLVPADIMRWYFTEAAPTMFVLNCLCVPAFGWMLLRVQYQVLQQAHLSAAAQVDPITRLLSLDAFTREVSHFHAADDAHRIAAVAAITLKNASWLKKTWGDDAHDKALGALRIRLAALFNDQRPLGIDPSSRILVPIAAREVQDLRPLRKALRRLASETPLSLDDDINVPLAVLVESFNIRSPSRPDLTALDIRQSISARRHTSDSAGTVHDRASHTADPSLPNGICSQTFRRLFDETDTKMRRVIRQG